MKINKNSTPEELAAYARLYTQMIRWSDEDKKFIGSLPEICGDCCDGETRAEVASKLDEIALDLVTDKANGEDCGTIPEPGILAVIAKPAYAGEDAAQHVASLRARFGLNQHKFAALLGVSRATVASWETGKRRPDGASARLLQIAERTPEAVLR